MMTTTIALFRGINVGGRNKLPMRDLTTLLEGLGLRSVRTYIQSGNVVFERENNDGNALSDCISATIEEQYGFAPQVLLLGLDAYRQAISANPFPDGENEPKTLHLYFLAAVPKDPDLAALERIKRDSERFCLEGKVFYLYAPEGIGRSKLAARVEKALGVPATARNWRSVCKILTLAEQLDDEAA